MKECHRCEFNGKGNEVCLKCVQGECYSYPFNQYILDTYDPPQPDTSCSEKPTSLDDDVEDKFIQALYNIFDLSYNELCCLKSIMNGKDLSEYAKEMEKMSQNNQEFSRFRAFQTRKGILSKLGKQFALALTTKGQRKKLKGKDNITK